MEILQIIIILLILLFIIWVSNKYADKSSSPFEKKDANGEPSGEMHRSLNIIQKLKQLPRQNYHILGYITFCYFLYVVHDSWDYGMDYEHYEILRWLVTCFSVWTSIRIFRKKPQSLWILIFGAIAVLFNPIAKISMHYEVWQKVDVAVIIIFLVYAIKNRPKFKD